MPATDRLILALDAADRDTALEWVRGLRPELRWVKVGLELFVAAGPELVRTLRGQGLEVFLDLKLHDIPNTVAGAVRAAARLEVQMLTLHAGGGKPMLEAAVAAAREAPKPPLLLGVTVLTSLGPADLQALDLPGSAADRVLAWAGLSQAAGLGGVVASGHEAAELRRRFPGLKLVVPGIRPAGAQPQDQARVMTPAAALRAGADYLVVGRAITAAADPRAAWAAVAAEIEGA
ncbi:MAG: orotidine-5'-phosphate decarboxylase [Terriglobales bacterium]